MTIGNIIKDLRKEKGLSQRRLAAAVGVSQKAIDNWEKDINEPTAGKIVALADFFGCSVDFLLGREDEFGNINAQGVGDIEARLFALFLKLDEAAQKELLDFARFLTIRNSK